MERKVKLLHKAHMPISKWATPRRPLQESIKQSTLNQQASLPSILGLYEIKIQS